MDPATEFARTGEAAVREAGLYLKANLGGRVEASYKGAVDLVTPLDLGAQDMLVGRLGAAFPGPGRDRSRRGRLRSRSRPCPPGPQPVTREERTPLAGGHRAPVPGRGEGARKFNLQHAYYHSKQAQVMITFDLAERLRGTGVSVHCVRVGNVAIPDERLVHLPKWMRRMYEAKRKFSMGPEKMAETYVWLAADPTGQQQTGAYWDAPGIAVRANKRAYNKETQRHLWHISANLLGVKTG